ncbi:MAG TPA: hypothetical protein VK474_12170 [Chthoniobacterales bacterium]|nr:hypothetical protein [Chthoniobacterales bacterium]
MGKRAFAALVIIAFIPLLVSSSARAAEEPVNVLVLGDSLALCGFGKRLDERFRADPKVAATYTYMTCGTNPLSWLKQKPYTSIKTRCGYWSIESTSNSETLREMQDTYGMTHNHRPKAYPVPKLDDLLKETHPDILVIQTGSNLFGLFPDAKTVHATRHAEALQKYLQPFLDEAISPPSRLRKIYWVNPPVSGRVSTEVQDFLFEQTRAQLSPAALVIDSRALVAYPYKHMDADKEHFLGEDMTEWADKVFDIIERDLAAQPLANLRPLSETRGAPLVAQAVLPTDAPARAEPVAPTPAAVPAETPNPTPVPRAEPVQAAEATPQAEPPRHEVLQIQGRLVFKSQPMPVKELLPYEESLVAYVYDVEKVQKGRYDERQILVMHPAHIGLKPQRLKYRIGKRYKLRLAPVEGTLWETAKARDESGLINLQPYIRLEDRAKHPGARKR